MTIAYTDGACKALHKVGDLTLGPGGCGVVIYHDKKLLFESSFTIGTMTTTNIAEWSALIECLEYFQGYGIPGGFATIRCDSKLVVEQFNKNWRVKTPHLQPLASKAWELSKGMPLVVTWIPRRQNTYADELSKMGRLKFYHADF